jgi:amino acid transporter
MWIFSNTFSGAAVSLGFAYYLTAAFPGLPSSIVAAAMCIAFTLLNLVGARESASVNNFLVAIKLAILAFFVVFGAFYINTANYQPFTPLSGGVLFGAFFIFFAYGGFARIAVVSEEVKNAKRNVPLAMLLSLGISMTVYILVGIVAAGLVFGTSACRFNLTPNNSHGSNRQHFGGADYFCWRHGCYGKCFVDFDFRSFKNGVLYGTRKRSPLNLSEDSPPNLAHPQRQSSQQEPL